MAKIENQTLFDMFHVQTKYKKMWYYTMTLYIDEYFYRQAMIE